eukprot:gene24674-26545_t
MDQIIFAGWTHEPAETLAQGLVAMMPPALEHVFFSDSGSTAVEVALKMALGFWANRGEPRSRILVLEHSYHGDTIGAMSVGARGVYNQAYAPLLFDVGTIPYPAAGAEQATLDALEQACRAAPAAFIVEPLVLGAGGMLFYPPRILAEMRAICARHGVRFLADEVMTAWGRTGTLLACEQAGVVPDILCLSKGLTGGAVPLAVTMATAAIFDAHLSTDRSRMFFHSSSYTANPIACAAGIGTLETYQEEGLLTRGAELAPYWEAGLHSLKDHPHVVDIRNIGLIGAIELQPIAGSPTKRAFEAFLAAFADGLLIRTTGDIIALSPPLIIEKPQIDELIDKLGRVLKAAA